MGASESKQYAVGMADALVKVGAYTEEAVPVSDYVEEEFAVDIRSVRARSPPGHQAFSLPRPLRSPPFLSSHRLLTPVL